MTLLSTGDPLKKRIFPDHAAPPFFFLIPFPKLFIAGAGGPPQSPPQQPPRR
jgi:hypothetical protein